MWQQLRKLWVKPLFNEEEQSLIVQAVKAAETATSGEIRVYVESNCTYIDALDRAKEIFIKLQMQHTELGNAVLVYVALRDKQLAVYGDVGIHEKVGSSFWQNGVRQMIAQFNKENYVHGIVQIITEIGFALKHHFPYNKETDKNELPDNIIFGK
jgi:uncharacterized membrane protein